jgi:3'-phosphoadenosine 5'-phosphosulfate sulfotransferase (PAPS reductase)/FAD synthetase
MESGEADSVVHIDTGIGIPETQEFVRETCREHGWPLEVVSSDFDYDEIVEENQFPGPAVHIIMYSKLKERALRIVARWTKDKPIFVTGVRKHESEARFKNVEPEQEDSSWIWRANIHDFTQSDVDAYIDEHGLNRSPVKQKFHHSGECLCGAFGNRTEELVLLEAHYPETAERIKALESEVQDEHGADDKRSYWAHGGMSSIDLRALLADNDETQMMLCNSCEAMIQDE